MFSFALSKGSTYSQLEFRNLFISAGRSRGNPWRAPRATARATRSSEVVCRRPGLKGRGEDEGAKSERLGGRFTAFGWLVFVGWSWLVGFG